ncbi:MAG: hypothetical protein HQK50_12865 [Oligoflexia bacterium]|nr:hypothetical protein [Oligoflexia bacterium]
MRKPSDLFFYTFLALIVLGLLLQLFYFAIRIKYWEIFPDEYEHYLRSNFYLKEFMFFISDGPQTYTYGSLRTNPFLYHFLFGNAMRVVDPLNLSQASVLLYLRFLNLLLALVKYYYAYLTIKLLTEDRAIKLLVMVLLTNLIMYVSLSVAISYDNLVNTMAVISFYYLLKMVNTQSEEVLQFRLSVTLFLLASLVGTLTKMTYLPLLAIQLVILCFFYRKLMLSFKAVLTSFKPIKIKTHEYVIAVAIIILLILNGGIYLRNLILYHSPLPTCGKVLGEQICRDFSGMYLRDYTLKEQNKKTPVMSFGEYLGSYFEQTLGSIVGIHAHKTLSRNSSECAKEIWIITLAILLLLFFNFKECFSNPVFNTLFFSSLAYMSVVLFHNYATYLEVRLFGIGLQGRYNFPIIVNLIIVLVYGALSGLHRFWWIKWVKWPIVFYVSYVFIRGGFYYFNKHVDPSWFN